MEERTNETIGAMKSSNKTNHSLEHELSKRSESALLESALWDCKGESKTATDWVFGSNSNGALTDG
jgi:hypothetical protein